MFRIKTDLKPALYLLAITSSMATTAHAGDLGQAALNMSNTLGFVANLATAIAYILGFGYLISALMKFKKHHQSPSQMPIGTPITECFMAATLIFLPFIANLSGDNLFNENMEKSGKKAHEQVPVEQPRLPGLTQLPPPNKDFRHSNQEHYHQALGIKSAPKAASAPTTAPQPAPVDIRDRYKFD